MDDEPTTQEEAIRRALIMERLIRALRKHNSKKPDSLGDRIFRCRLAYVGAKSNHARGELIKKAEELLKEAGE